jgi:hypothetical protein
MPERWIGVSVTVTRFVSDHQPGIVEAEIRDAHGQCLRFVDKQPFFGREDLGPDDSYPQAGVMLCWVRRRQQDSAGRELIRVELYGEGIEVEVRPEALVEGTYNSRAQRPWNGLAEPNAT